MASCCMQTEGKWVKYKLGASIAESCLHIGPSSCSELFHLDVLYMNCSQTEQPWQHSYTYTRRNVLSLMYTHTELCHHLTNQPKQSVSQTRMDSRIFSGWVYRLIGSRGHWRRARRWTSHRPAGRFLYSHAGPAQRGRTNAAGTPDSGLSDDCNLRVRDRERGHHGQTMGVQFHCNLNL